MFLTDVHHSATATSVIRLGFDLLLERMKYHHFLPLSKLKEGWLQVILEGLG